MRMKKPTAKKTAPKRTSKKRVAKPSPSPKAGKTASPPPQTPPAKKATKPARKSSGKGKAPRTARKAPLAPEPRLLRHHGSDEFTLAILDDLLRIVGDTGCHAEVAASNLGIPVEVFAEWMRQGKSDRDSGVRSDLAYMTIALAGVESGVEIRLLRKVIRHPDWRASTWFLEARFSERWTPKDTTEKTATPPAPDLFNWRNRQIPPPSQIAKNLAELEESVLRGNPLAMIPLNPHVPEHRPPDGGLRGAIAGRLKRQMDRGIQFPDFVRIQVEEYFNSEDARNPLPPEEVQDQMIAAAIAGL